MTEGSPHDGIETRFAAADLLNEVIGAFGSEIFDRDNMFGYLTPGRQLGADPPRGWHANEIEDFDPRRVFCIIGTNPGDYGLARHAVGVKSDGLVRVDNAYIRRAPRAFVHRSHSGRYGLVNSEESYQSLRRFLFGSRRVEVDLAGVDLIGDEKENLAAMSNEELLAAVVRDDADDDEFDRPETRAYWQADVQVTVRGLPVVLHEQSVEHNCPIQLSQEQRRRRREAELRRRGLRTTAEDTADSADTPVPLATVFLLDATRFAADSPNDPRPPRCRYTMRLRLFRLEQHNGFLGLGRHLEQVADWEDALIVDIGHPDGVVDDQPRAWAAWNSEVPGSNADHDPISDKPLALSEGLIRIAFPSTAKEGILGKTARLSLRITPWQ